MKKSLFSFFSIGLVGLALWAFYFEPASLQVSKFTIGIPAWPSECSDFSVAVLSDLHVGSPFNGIEKLKQIVEQTNQANPDLVLLPGDFVIHGVVGGSFETPENAAAVLSGLKAGAGVYAVLGNHDWWLDAMRVQLAMESVGIPVLEDRALKIDYQGCAFYLVGVSDWWEGPHDIDKALSTVPSSAASLLFTHNPDIFPTIPLHVNLTIAGHTHGGQVYLPGIGRPLVPSEHGERFAVGHIIEEGKHMFVSSGIGTSILPVRFLVAPEITLLILNRES